MSWGELKYLVYADLYRCYGRANPYLVLRELLWGVAGKFIIWMRVAAFLSTCSRWCLPLYLFARLMHRRYTIKYGINIAYQATIGPGLSIAHFGGINVNQHVRIGRNCNLSQGVTIGISNRGGSKGVPVIGDNVYIGPGAKLFGAIRVGDNVAVGANCVVVEDVPDNAVVFGVPARIIGYAGSAGYVNRIDYAAHFPHPAKPAPVEAQAAGPLETAGPSDDDGERLAG